MQRAELYQIHKARLREQTQYCQCVSKYWGEASNEHFAKLKMLKPKRSELLQTLNSWKTTQLHIATNAAATSEPG
jgi:hypothetical protein